jgi:hypothetical protein
MKSQVMTKTLWLVLVLAFGMTACSDMKDNSLLSDEAKVAAASSLNKVANSSQLALTVDANSLTVSPGADQTEITGDCFISTYPKHAIKADLVSATNTATSTPMTVMYIQGSAAATKGVCVQGRYDLILNANDLVAGMNYVKITLIAWDANNVQVNNDANASRTIYVIK